MKKAKNAATDSVVPALLISFAKRSSCLFSGVFTPFSSVAWRATLPISVLSPTAETTIRPLPFITIDERSNRLQG